MIQLTVEPKPIQLPTPRYCVVVPLSASYPAVIRRFSSWEGCRCSSKVSKLLGIFTQKGIHVQEMLRFEIFPLPSSSLRKLDAEIETDVARAGVADGPVEHVITAPDLNRRIFRNGLAH